jgi:hypothetical protein
MTEFEFTQHARLETLSHAERKAVIKQAHDHVSRIEYAKLAKKIKEKETGDQSARPDGFDEPSGNSTGTGSSTSSRGRGIWKALTKQAAKLGIAQPKGEKDWAILKKQREDNIDQKRMKMYREMFPDVSP